jgi:hypothetical protein
LFDEGEKGSWQAKREGGILISKHYLHGSGGGREPETGYDDELKRREADIEIQLVLSLSLPVRPRIFLLFD